MQPLNPWLVSVCMIAYVHLLRHRLAGSAEGVQNPVDKTDGIGVQALQRYTHVQCSLYH